MAIVHPRPALSLPDQVLCTDARRMAVRVHAHKTIEDASGPYTAFLVGIALPNGHSWTIKKRYSEFYSFRGQLGSKSVAGIPFPGKKLNKLKPPEIDARMGGLNGFMQACLLRLGDWCEESLSAWGKFLNFEENALGNHLRESFKIGTDTLDSIDF